MSKLVTHLLPDLDRLQCQIRSVPDVDLRPTLLDGISYYFRRMLDVTWLVLRTPSLVVLALLQWVTTVGVYFLWAQFLSWIPDAVWSDENKLQDQGLNGAMVVWSLLCLGVGTLPIAIFTGALGTYQVRADRRQSTSLLACLRHAMRDLGRLWLLHWVDGWLTCTRILDRLPRGLRDAEEQAETMAAEVLYHCWKLGLAGMVPAVLNGRGYAQAAQESLALLKHRPIEIVWLRASYSMNCWVVGGVTYAATAWFAWSHADRFHETPGFLFHFYCFAGLPIAAATLVVQVVLRPTYVLAVSDLYMRLATRHKLTEITTGRSSTALVLVVFALLVAGIVSFVLFRTHLGIGLQ